MTNLTNTQLSKGLAYLRRLVSTKTFEERSEMLTYDILLIYDFLYDAMSECNLQTFDGKVLSEWSEEEKEGSEKQVLNSRRRSWTVSVGFDQTILLSSSLLHQPLPPLTQISPLRSHNCSIS